MGRHAVAWLLFFVPLWWLWHLLAGEWNPDEWVAAAAAAAVAAALATIAVARADAGARVPLAIVKSVPSALAMVFVDFAIVMRALFSRREGEFRTTPFEHPDDTRHRAWATIVADFSPNAYVVDITDGKTLTHHLVPHKRSQEPA